MQRKKRKSAVLQQGVFRPVVKTTDTRRPRRLADLGATPFFSERPCRFDFSPVCTRVAVSSSWTRRSGYEVRSTEGGREGLPVPHGLHVRHVWDPKKKRSEWKTARGGGTAGASQSAAAASHFRPKNSLAFCHRPQIAARRRPTARVSRLAPPAKSCRGAQTCRRLSETPAAGSGTGGPVGSARTAVHPAGLRRCTVFPRTECAHAVFSGGR